MMRRRISMGWKFLEGSRSLWKRLSGQVGYRTWKISCLFSSMTSGEEKMKKLNNTKETIMRRFMEEHREMERKTTLSDAQQKSMLHALLSRQKEDPQNYPDDMIGSLILTLFQGATVTSALTIVWALSLLLNHPQVLKKAEAEIDGIVGNIRIVEESDKSNLPYIQSIVNETLLKYPTGPLALPCAPRLHASIQHMGHSQTPSLRSGTSLANSGRKDLMALTEIS